MKNKWNKMRAKKYINDCVNGFLQDNMFHDEAGKLLVDIKIVGKYKTEEGFRNLIETVLEWEKEFIDEAVKEIMK